MCSLTLPQMTYHLLGHYPDLLQPGKHLHPDRQSCRPQYQPLQVHLALLGPFEAALWQGPLTLTGPWMEMAIHVL